MVSTANMSKQESYRVSSSYLPQPRVEKTQLFQTMHWVFGLNANKPSFCKWNHGFIPALDTWKSTPSLVNIGGPLLYNLNSSAKKTEQNRILLDLKWLGFFFQTMINPTSKNRVVPALATMPLRCRQGPRCPPTMSLQSNKYFPHPSANYNIGPWHPRPMHCNTSHIFGHLGEEKL